MNKEFRTLSTFLLLLIVVSSCSSGQNKTNQTLQHKLDALVESFDGMAGIYVRNLKTGEEYGINADSVFRTASIVKIPILVGVFDKIEHGALSYHQTFIYRDSLAHGGSGILQFFKDSTEVDLSKLVTLMLARSDNTASHWCQELAGGGKTINKWLADHGFKHTRVNSNTPGRKQNYGQFGWGQTTPKEMANLLAMIRNSEAISQKADDRMYRDLTRTYWDDYALSQIPPTIQVASKQGMVSASRSEVVLVEAPNGAYVFYVGTQHNENRSWGPDNEGWQFARDVSALLWNYFEPQSNWQPADSAQQYWDWKAVTY